MKHTNWIDFEVRVGNMSARVADSYYYIWAETFLKPNLQGVYWMIPRLRLTDYLHEREEITEAL